MPRIVIRTPSDGPGQVKEWNYDVKYGLDVGTLIWLWDVGMPFETKHELVTALGGVLSPRNTIVTCSMYFGYRHVVSETDIHGQGPQLWTETRSVRRKDGGFDFTHIEQLDVEYFCRVIGEQAIMVDAFCEPRKEIALPDGDVVCEGRRYNLKGSFQVEGDRLVAEYYISDFKDSVYQEAQHYVDTQTPVPADLPDADIESLSPRDIRRIAGVARRAAQNAKLIPG